jgi:hypothetical protein
MHDESKILNPEAAGPTPDQVLLGEGGAVENVERTAQMEMLKKVEAIVNAPANNDIIQAMLFAWRIHFMCRMELEQRLGYSMDPAMANTLVGGMAHGAMQPFNRSNLKKYAKHALVDFISKTRLRQALREEHGNGPVPGAATAGSAGNPEGPGEGSAGAADPA